MAAGEITMKRIFMVSALALYNRTLIRVQLLSGDEEIALKVVK